MYAVILTGGKQYKVFEGAEIYVEKLNTPENEEIIFNEVLMLGGEKTVIGTPHVDGAKVTAKVLKHGRQKKIIVFKYKQKKNYSKKQGHRQAYTKLLIEKIER